MIKKNTVTLVFALLGSAAAAVAVGCSSSSGGTGGSTATGGISGGGSSGSTGGVSGGGSSGSTGGGSGSGSALVPTETGYVVNDTLGVVGAWYAYGDNVGEDGKPGTGKCQTVGKNTDDKCSSITAPDLTMTATKGFPPTDMASAKMCTKGSAAKVIADTADTTADYSNIFGTGIGFDFSNAGTADGGVGKQPWDATGHHVVGVSFDIGEVPKGFRVEFATIANGNDNPYWGGASSNTSPVQANMTNTVMFADVGGPMYVKASSRIPADWTKLVSIQFHVSTGTSGAIAFDYCISNLKLIVQ